MLRRAVLLVVCAVVVPACGGKSKSPAPPAAEFRILDASGGSSDSGNIFGDGGYGGNITIEATGAIQLATGDAPPPMPTSPVPPTTGTELTNALIDANAPLGGNLLVSATLQVTGAANPAFITTVSGDIVISGTMIGALSAGVGTVGITLNAPAGTIYVLGEIRTRGTPGYLLGGGVTLSAQRIVISGVIDTRGAFGDPGPGGEGGFVSLDATDDILILGGSIRTGGGGGRVPDGAGGLIYGGSGGDVTMLAADELSVFGSVVTDGGAATAPTQFPEGGKAGAISMRGDGKTDVRADLSLRGGFASGGSFGGLGGQGGLFTTGSPAPYRLYGSVVTAGGGAFADSAPSGVLLRGGNAGGMLIGAVGNPVATLEIGRGAIVSSGGSGRFGGSNGGTLDASSLDGDIDAAGPISAAGGSGHDVGGSGGSVLIHTDDNPLGNTANHHLTFQGSIDTRVGAHEAPVGSSAGFVNLQCGADLTWTGSIQASGMGKFSFGGPVVLQTLTRNLPATGKLTLTGDINSQGGISGDGYYNGQGGLVTILAAKGLTFSGSISTRGYTAGEVILGAGSGDCDVSGTLIATTDATTLTPSPGASISLGSYANLRFSGVADASASNVNPASPDLQGGPGGNVSFLSTGGTVTILEGSLVRADGSPSTTGAGHFPGGAGGSIQVQTPDHAATIHGTLLARGGSNAADGGGAGGRFVVDTDSDANGVGGAITLAADALVDVSGGTGASGGSALNNGGVAPADSNGANLAVVLDAAGSLLGSPDGAGVGVVRNLGRIVARGNSPSARGGDLWFDGQALSGIELTGADAGNVDLSGPGGAGAFFPN